MKKATMILKGLILTALVFVFTVSQAQQWATHTNNTDIYNLNTGNVGIGSTGAEFTPAEKLHVNGGTNFARILVESSYSGNSGMFAVASLRLKNAASGDLFQVILRKNNLYHEMIQSCYDAPNNTWREFMYFNYGTRKYEIRNGIIDTEFKTSGKVLFNNTGNVGIGTSNPTEKLSVNGNIKCKQVEVSLTGWSDFVFNEDYKLMPLEELDQYLKEHKHLPDVPSAEEVISNGNNLGEMDAILLQKIEELTLYVIELKKENEQLKQIISK